MKRETRFASRHPAGDIISKIEEVAKPLGFNVQKQNYKVAARLPLLPFSCAIFFLPSESR